MDLAYSAYVPLTGDFSGLAPGLFMEDNIVSAEDLLDDYGIKSVAFNTDKKDTVCHIIGHKQIYVDINYNTSDNTNGGNNNGTLGILEGTGKHGTIGYFSDDFQSDLRTDVSMDSTGMSCVGSSEAFWNTLNSDDANNTDCMIKTNTNTNGGNDNDRYLGVLEGIDRNESIGVYTDNDSSRLRTDDFVGNVYFDSRKNSGTFQNTLNSDGANNTDCMIKTNTNTNTNGGNNGYLGILEGTGRCKPIGVFSGSNQSGLRTDDFVGTVGSNCTGNSEIFGNTLNSDNTDCMRILVVVDIRGSSTLKDWFTDIGTEIGLSDFSFKAGMETVLKSLYHGTGETYVLLYRCVHSIILPYTAVEITTPFQT